MTILNKQMMNINLSQLLYSLSFALDIAENRNYEHSRRTAYIAFNIAQYLGLDESLVNEIFYSSLIHDIGMTGQLSVYSIENIHIDHCLKAEHCYLGAKISDQLPLPDALSDNILYHHENWDGSGVYGLKGDEVPLPSQIIHIADSFDIDYSEMLNIRLERGCIDRWLAEKKGQAFNPFLADALLHVTKRDKFWFDLKFCNIHQLVDIIKPKEEIIIDIEGLRKIADSFAMLIDNKSRFTHTHSRGVAETAKKIAIYLGYDDITTKKIEIAGLLHDLGKLAVPNEILDKPEKLTKSEFDIIKAHPYYTKLILQQISGLEDIAEWAGNHHEKLNGKGYPEKLVNHKMMNQDHILAVSDIYQALIEDRPYREGMSHEKAMNILYTMSNKELISKEMAMNLDKAMGTVLSA